MLKTCAPFSGEADGDRSCPIVYMHARVRALLSFLRLLPACLRGPARDVVAERDRSARSTYGILDAPRRYFQASRLESRALHSAAFRCIPLHSALAAFLNKVNPFRVLTVARQEEIRFGLVLNLERRKRSQILVALHSNSEGRRHLLCCRIFDFNFRRDSSIAR